MRSGFFSLKMPELSKQELHNLAMHVVGEDLKKQGYEFMGVNSKLKKDPQFVALKNKKLHFVVVRAIAYPNDPSDFDVFLMENMKQHALKFNAKTFYAGVGLANSEDYEKPIDVNSDYVVNYKGLQEI